MAMDKHRDRFYPLDQFPDKRQNIRNTSEVDPIDVREIPSAPYEPGLSSTRTSLPRYEDLFPYE